MAKTNFESVDTDYIASQFETTEWSLTTEDGRVLHLLDEGKPDPARQITEAKGSY